MANNNTVGIPIYGLDNGGAFIGYECPSCFGKGDYSMRWDSYLCTTCGIWLDNATEYSDSPFYGRPEFPTIRQTPFGKVVD